MKDHDEMFEAATETPAFLGCPAHMPAKLPGGFDGTEAGNTNLTDSTNETNPSNPLNPSNPCLKVSEEKKKKLEDSYLSMRGLLEKISDIALAADAKCGVSGRIGENWMTCSKAIGEIRRICKQSFAEEIVLDYEWLARIMTSDHFEPECLAKAIEAVQSNNPNNPNNRTIPTFYTPGWLVELAKKMQGNKGAECVPHSPEEQSALQREEARQKRKIHWTCYPTKVDLCVMGMTEQNGKVYEVRVNKRKVADVQDTYGQCKVNGKTVLTVSFTGGAWMLKRILTEGMQALVNYKAKKNRDRRRNFAKRAAAAKRQAHDNKGAAGDVK